MDHTRSECITLRKPNQKTLKNHHFWSVTKNYCKLLSDNVFQGQLKAVEDKYRDREREILGLKDRADNECMNMCSEVSKLRSLNENLRRTIEERETEIDSLR